MPVKEHLGSPEGAPGLDAHQAPSVKPSLDMAFQLPPEADGVKEKQVGAAGNLAQVPIGKIEELDESRQLLAGTIDLALALAEVRMQAECIHLIARDSSPEAGLGPWERLAEDLNGISPLDPTLAERTDFSPWLSGSITDLGKVREEAALEAQRIIDQRLLPSGRLEPRDKRDVMNALGKLRNALKVCVGACDRESRTHLERIGQRVHLIIEPFREQHESSARSTVSKDPDSGQKGDRATPPSPLDRKLSAESNNGDLEQPKGRNADGLE